MDAGVRDKENKYLGTAFGHTIAIVVNPKFEMHSKSVSETSKFLDPTKLFEICGYYLSLIQSEKCIQYE